MADQLESALDNDALFDYDEGGANGRPPRWLPILQGDVFSGVAMPGLPANARNPDGLAMLFMHPCTMREGARLRPIVTMIEVERHADQGLRTRLDRMSTWFKGMPLPGLKADELYIGNFMHIASVSSTLLNIDQRIASLSAEGRARFQQRIIKHLTRHSPSISILKDATDAVDTEADLQAAWAESWALKNGDDDATLEALTKEFDIYMNEVIRVGGIEASRRQHLSNGNRSAVISEAMTRARDIGA